jgi:hypothetical protein
LYNIEKKIELLTKSSIIHENEKKKHEKGNSIRIKIGKTIFFA